MDSTQIIVWNRRVRNALTPKAHHYTNFGNMPIIRWSAPATSTASGGRAGRWTLNQGDLPFFFWRSSPGGPLPEIRFTCSGKSTGLWSADTSVGSVGFEADGFASAAWLGSASLHGSFTCRGQGSARWAASGGPLLGSFQCDGLATVLLLVGLDGVIYTCLTGQGATAPPRIPNYVF